MKIIPLAAIIICCNTYAGFNGLTIHSRANCANNESITWDATHDWWLTTYSYHYSNNKEVCAIASPGDGNPLHSGWDYTWRSAAVHWGEGLPVGATNYIVVGRHGLLQSDMKTIVTLGEETVTDCSIYDGWWDTNPPTEKVNSIPIKEHSKFVIPAFIGDLRKTQDAEIAVKGYHAVDSRAARFLLQLPKHATSEIKSFSLIRDLSDTHLKASVKDIKLAFKFDGLKVDNIIGYAPIGAYNNGWTGIKVFFKNADSICSYSYLDLTASNGSVQQVDTIKLNGRQVTTNVEGSDESGFVYSVNWVDHNNLVTLDCANANYSPTIKNRTFQVFNAVS